MRAKQVNLLTALIAVILFSFSCFCISRMTQISKWKVVSPATCLALGLLDCWVGEKGVR